MDLPPLPPALAPFAVYLVPLAVFVGLAGALFVLRLVLFRQLARLTRHTENDYDNVVLDAIRGPSVAWVLALAVHLALPTAPLPEGVVGTGRTVLVVLLTISMTLAAANLAGGLLRVVVARADPSSLQAGSPRSVSGLGQAMVKGLIALLGLMALLRTVGVEIAPLLTALGVGGLAVALALQDTLGNFFAGVHLLMEKPFQMGDFIRLETGQEGTVLDVGWRTTRIRTLQDHVVVLPNSKLAGSTIINFHLPDPRTRLSFPVNVAYGTDPERARSVLIEEARAVVAGSPLFAPDPGPDAGMTGLGAYALEFLVRFHVRDVRDQFPALDLMHRRITTRLVAEGIEIPFPTQALLLPRDEA